MHVVVGQLLIISFDSPYAPRGMSLNRVKCRIKNKLKGRRNIHWRECNGCLEEDECRKTPCCRLYMCPPCMRGHIDVQTCYGLSHVSCPRSARSDAVSHSTGSDVVTHSIVWPGM